MYMWTHTMDARTSIHWALMGVRMDARVRESAIHYIIECLKSKHLNSAERKYCIFLQNQIDDYNIV